MLSWSAGSEGYEERVEHVVARALRVRRRVQLVRRLGGWIWCHPNARGRNDAS